MKSKFTATDFTNLKYNVVKVPKTTKVVDYFEDLKKYPEFTTGYLKQVKAAPDKCIRYALLMYTDNVIHRVIPELAGRKREAALLAGIEPDENGKFSNMYEEIFLCEKRIINDIFVRVIRMNHNIAFRNLITFEEALEKEIGKLIDPDKRDDKETVKVIHENINRFKIDIEKLQLELLKEDINNNLLDSLYSCIDNIQLGITPEDNAMLIKDKNFKKFHKDPYRSSKTKGRFD